VRILVQTQQIMKKNLLLPLMLFVVTAQLTAQVEPDAGHWKPWFISSPDMYRPGPPPSNKAEMAEVLLAQRDLDSLQLQKIIFWNAGAPGYRWHNMTAQLWMKDITGNGVLVQLLMGTAIYDATIVAWDAKYRYNRPRPFAVDTRVKVHGLKPDSPSYPCEHSVAAGVAATLLSHFYPALADSVNRMAQEVMASRIAAGIAYPTDTQAGFELGKQIAEKEIQVTKDLLNKKEFDGKMPQEPGVWTGKNPLLPLAGLNKTVVLDSASQFRPGPPPDFAKEMEELRNFKQTFGSKANAWLYASQPVGESLLVKKIFEYNLHLNPPRAARIYAAAAVANYDVFASCFDAKYAYWGIRPDQYDTTYQPLVPTPPFPGYPSGHAMFGGMLAELFSYFFPADKAQFMKVATDGAESRFQAGIHFRTDNEAGLDLGKKVAAKIVERVRADGADDGAFGPLRGRQMNATNNRKR
jgi:membrane-associated phospholipid phosphatase